MYSGYWYSTVHIVLYYVHCPILDIVSFTGLLYTLILRVSLVVQIIFNSYTLIRICYLAGVISSSEEPLEPVLLLKVLYLLVLDKTMDLSLQCSFDSSQ